MLDENELMKLVGIPVTHIECSNGTQWDGRLPTTVSRYLRECVDEIAKLRAENERLRSYDISAVYVVRPVSPFGKHARRPYGMIGVTVESCLGVDDSQKWAIRRGGNCLNKDGDWQFEPLPSSRDDKFYAACRWNSLDEALAFARTALEA